MCQYIDASKEDLNHGQTVWAAGVPEGGNGLQLTKRGDNARGKEGAGSRLIEVAEREGFEPSKELSPFTRLAGERLQPTRPSLLETASSGRLGASR